MKKLSSIHLTLGLYVGLAFTLIACGIIGRDSSDSDSGSAEVATEGRVGTYKGKVSGDDTGTIYFTISKNSNITGVVVPTNGKRFDVSGSV